MMQKNIQFDQKHKELIKPILPGLPISVFASSFSPESYTYVNWHWHEAFQYCYVTKGIIDYLLPGQIFTVTERSGIFINYAQSHLIRCHDTAGSASYICVDVPPSFISYDEQSRIFLRYLKPVIEHPVPPAMLLSKYNKNDQHILKCLTEIVDFIKSEENLIEIEIRIRVMQMWKDTFLKLERSESSKPKPFYNDDRLKAIFLFIREHYQEKLTLDMIAEQASLSRSECSRYFKKMTGQSLFSYLTAYRLNKSIDFLRDTDMSIAEIAGAVGFCSQSYFTDCFRKEKGITPNKYKALSTRIAADILKIE